MTSLDLSTNAVCNVIHMTHNTNHDSYGDRIGVLFMKGTPLLKETLFRAGVNGVINFVFEPTPMPNINEPVHYEMHQRYVSEGNYRYFIKINGEEVLTILNTDARQFYNVKVYASDPWYRACPGTIKNFKLTNFL